MADTFTYLTIIVADADRATAQADLGTGFFNTAASATGAEPASHWFTSGPFENAEVDRIADEVTWAKRIRSADWQAALASCGLQMIVPVAENV